MGQETNHILRDLSEGLDFQPDWRNRVVEQYIAEYAKIPNHKTPGDILMGERDPFVKHAFLFRLGVGRVNAKAFEFSYRTQANNHTTGAASMIKAMAIADRRANEIAQELRTERWYVTTYLRLFFDVERFLSCDAWLRLLIFPPDANQLSSPEAIRERRWLSSAYLQGWPGLEKMLFNRGRASENDVRQLRVEIEAALGARALEFVTGLQASGAPVNMQDLERFVAVRESSARFPIETGNEDKVGSWVRELLMVGAKKNPEKAKALSQKTIDIVPRYRRIQNSSAKLSVRMLLLHQPADG